MSQQNQNPQTNKDDYLKLSYRRIALEIGGVVLASISVTMITALIGFMESIIRLQEKVQNNTEIIRELKQQHEQKRSK